MNLGKLKTKKKSLKQPEKNNTFLIRKHLLNDSGFLILNHGSKKEVALCFSRTERKELATPNSVPGENILL